MTTTTVTRSTHCIELSTLASDWLWTDTFPGNAHGIPVWSIHFVATAAADKCILQEDSITGPWVFHRIATAVGDQVPSYFGGRLLKLVLDFSSGIYTALSCIIIILDKERH